MAKIVQIFCPAFVQPVVWRNYGYLLASKQFVSFFVNLMRVTGQAFTSCFYRRIEVARAYLPMVMKSLQFIVPNAKDASIDVQVYIMPGFYPHFHRHPETQLMWIISGRGTLVVEQHLFEFESGDLFYLGANQPHVFKTRFEDGKEQLIHAMAIFYDPYKKLAALFKLAELLPLQNFIHRSQAGFKADRATVKLLEKDLRSVKDRGGIEKIFSFLRLLEGLMNNRHLHTPLSIGKNKSVLATESDERIVNAKAFIKERYTNSSLSLKEISKQAHLTPQAFSRSFKKHTGTTYIAYLHDLRVQHACRLLTTATFNSILQWHITAALTASPISTGYFVPLWGIHLRSI